MKKIIISNLERAWKHHFHSHKHTQKQAYLNTGCPIFLAWPVHSSENSWYISIIIISVILLRLHFWREETFFYFFSSSLRMSLRPYVYTHYVRMPDVTVSSLLKVYRSSEHSFRRISTIFVFRRLTSLNAKFDFVSKHFFSLFYSKLLAWDVKITVKLKSLVTSVAHTHIHTPFILKNTWCKTVNLLKTLFSDI